MQGDLNRAPLSIALESSLRSELAPGERVIWSAQPDPRRMRAVFAVWLFAIPWTLFSLGWTGIASSAFIAGYLQDDPSFTWWFVFFPLFGVPFIAVGGWMLYQPFKILNDAKHAIHAITDRRVMTLTVGRSRLVRSVELAKLGPISRTEKADGWGNIAIETGSHRDSDGDRVTDRFELVGIANVAKVEQMLRAAIQKG